mgnify:CR=1 FL=1|tara:strand:- start:500 stop:844 length:345 start_codon:yes stop_codon:yes gene_type:complete
MFIEVTKSKIRRLTITDADLNYVGSIAQYKKVIDVANLIVGEKVQIVNINNIEQLETYVIEGKDWGREAAINSPAVRKAQNGDLIIRFAQINIENAKSLRPEIVSPNETTNKLE